MLHEGNLSGQCPECEATVTLNDPLRGEIAQCPECGVELELVALAQGMQGLGLLFEVLPPDEENFGE